MFGWGELGLILILAVILLGPDKLPEVARQLGKIYAEYQKAKRRLELEILYSVEQPDTEFLEKIYEGNLSKEIEKEIEAIVESDGEEKSKEMRGENNLNLHDVHLKENSTGGNVDKQKELI